MTIALPKVFFSNPRKRCGPVQDSGKNRQNRLEMHQIAAINIRNETVKPLGDTVLTDEETKLIADWMRERKTVLEEREIDDILRTIDHLNLTAQWAQSKASDADLERVTDQLLLSMHDLRTILSRKKIERATNKP
jgi:hypothetical protein